MGLQFMTFIISWPLPVFKEFYSLDTFKATGTQRAGTGAFCTKRLMGNLHFSCLGFCKICIFVAIVTSLRKGDKKRTRSLAQATLPAPWSAEHSEVCLGIAFCQLCDPRVSSEL